MVKWHIIHKTWPQKKPKLWSICNWRHRFSYWYKDLHGNRGTVCKECKVWWKQEDLDTRIFKNKLFRKFMCNKPFWIIIGVLYIFIHTILDYLKCNRGWWWKFHKRSFKKMWKSNWKLYIDLLEESRLNLLNDENFKEYSKSLLGDDENNS